MSYSDECSKCWYPLEVTSELLDPKGNLCNHCFLRSKVLRSVQVPRQLDMAMRANRNVNWSAVAIRAWSRAIERITANETTPRQRS